MMAISLWCVLISGLLPYLGTAFAKWGFKEFDNNDPRTWLAKQTGFRARGNAAQANSFEAFPFFAAGVLTANLTLSPPFMVDFLAVIFVIARLLYILLYIANRPGLRSLCWSVGILSVVGLFIVSGYHG
jgi:uncharacterized MAPEG superfamily protein